MRIGVAGLGVMGAAVAARLMEVGHDVTVWNRTPEKTKPLAEAGAKLAATPAELASTVDATITMLTDAAAIDAVYNGQNGTSSIRIRPNCCRIATRFLPSPVFCSSSTSLSNSGFLYWMRGLTPER